MPPPTSSASSTPHSHHHRSRRIEDALSQLVDSLIPTTIPRRNEDDETLSETSTDEYARLEAAEADERRHRRCLEMAWRVLDSHTAAAAAASSTGIGGGGVVSADVINNAPDLIKRKLLRENASPDKAVRFSNLYSRLLTQPVLGQKWAILYLLYRIGEGKGPAGRSGGAETAAAASGGYGAADRGNVRRTTVTARVEDGGWKRDDGARSPLMDEHQLDHLLLRDKFGRRSVVDDIAPGSSVSAVGLDSPSAAAAAAHDGASVLTRNGKDRGSYSPRAVERKRVVERREREKEREGIPATSRGAVSITPDGESKSRSHSQAEQRQEEQQRQQKNEGGVEGGPAKPDESVILRDLSFTLQGVSSTNMKFVSPTSLKLPQTLPVPLVSLLHTLAEPCLLYRGLSAFVEETEGGLVKQSVRAAIGNELRSYLGLVATLEGEIRSALATVSDNSTEPKGTLKAGVTLKRCVVWMREATMALRLMSLIVEESRGKRGGQLITMIHEFSSSHGDPFVGAFAERLLAHVTRPFYGMLRQWIYDGELSDPYREFFVVEPEVRPSVDPRRVATSVWDDKYKLDDDLVPTIMTPEFAKKIFLIGKSLNFIRYGCGDSAWVAAYSRDASKELKYGDTATLETSIDEAYKTTMARLIYLMDSKFKLFDHLMALKKYLLLGQGDFIALLMESLASNLDRPANSQYRHTLTAQLEHAIRSSNAQYDSPDVLRRLDARMLELSHGEIGWDCFTLEYKIDAPVDVVITPWGSTQYLKVFNFLWRVKRVEFALGSTWRRCMTGARGVLGSVEDKVGQDWKRARCVISEMNHFISQLQYYILFEVIEASWDQLQVAISKPGCTLDDLIEAHTKYLNSITHKGLLGSSSSSNPAGNNREDSFLSQLHQILKIMLTYKDAVDGLYSFSVAEFTRRQEFTAKIETRTAQGQWGVTEKDLLQQSQSLFPFTTSTTSNINRPNRSDSATRKVPGSASESPSADSSFPLGGRGGGAHSKSPSEPITPTAAAALLGGVGTAGDEDHLLPSLRTRLHDLAADFRTRLLTLLGDLAYQPDVDMRFLGVVMNFNDVYQVVRRRRRGTGAGKDRERRKVGGEGESREREKEKEKGSG
ncbi:spindle pole body component [Histoplasma capsulatum var. duboisii H88]|uniref:Spindle pole body component n=2 Tax=Ajellomyces capsulatus (strain H88) TaxID=544711 RepID=F0U8B4_AJEC8|nr:spindle pole body component [Histoplasma capsulatum var. duboisii H88]